MKQNTILFFVFTLLTISVAAQSWVDSVDAYAREKYLPATKYKWLWTHAALLSTMVKQYELSASDKKPMYLEYIKKSMHRNMAIANGRTPNDVASALGLAFLYRTTGDEKYLHKAEKVYRDYLKTKRTKEGGVSHLLLFTELWDDTIFMIGQFLLQMYQATGNEQYLEEFMHQFRQHHQKLMDTKTGLWVHGWDSDQKTHCTFCSQRNWANKETRRSTEFWGRGNGWIVVTLSDALDIVPRGHTHRSELENYLKSMIANLPAYQDSLTGHWYQLPVRNTEPDNWIESSATAMFAYGIHSALRQGLVTDSVFHQCVTRAYQGLRKHSMVIVGGKYLTLTNVCVGTCIGDKHYYYKRKTKQGSTYGLGMAIAFGRRYEEALEH